MEQQAEHNRLNDYIQIIIQTDGFDFVVTNFIALREQYYECKQSSV